MTGMSFAASLRVIPAIAQVTLRQLLGRRRSVLLLLLAGVPVLLAIVMRAAGVEDVNGFAGGVLDAVAVTLVLPIVAVLFGTAAFGAEIEDGTIVYLLAKPVSRLAIVLAKLLGTAGITAVLMIGSVLLSSAIALLPLGDQGLRATEAFVVAMAVGSICYVSLFAALSLFTRRALLIGFAYALIWEGALSFLLPGISNLSVRQYSVGVGQAFFDMKPEEARLEPATALALALILLAVTLALTTRRLMRFEISGSGD